MRGFSRPSEVDVEGEHTPAKEPSHRWIFLASSSISEGLAEQSNKSFLAQKNTKVNVRRHDRLARREAHDLPSVANAFSAAGLLGKPILLYAPAVC